MIQDKRTEKRETAKIKKDAKSKAVAKTKKTKAVAKSKEIKAVAKTKKAEEKEATEEDEATDAVARINEKIKQTYDVKEKKNTPKNTTRKTITIATPKERERLAI